MAKKVIVNPGWDYYKKATYAPAVKKGNMLFKKNISDAHCCMRKNKKMVQYK